MRSATSRWLSLRNAQQFAAVMRQGQIVARSQHFVLHALRWNRAEHCNAEASKTGAQRRPVALFPATGPSQLYSGTIIPKRWSRRAVTRNLIKRQVRHAVLPRLPVLPGGLAIVIRQRAAFDPSRFVSASSPLLRTAVRQELIALVNQPDWQTLRCLSAPPENTSPAKTGTMAAGTIQSAS